RIELGIAKRQSARVGAQDEGSGQQIDDAVLAPAADVKRADVEPALPEQVRELAIAGAPVEHPRPGGPRRDLIGLLLKSRDRIVILVKSWQWLAKAFRSLA